MVNKLVQSMMDLPTIRWAHAKGRCRSASLGQDWLKNWMPLEGMESIIDQKIETEGGRRLLLFLLPRDAWMILLQLYVSQSMVF